MIETTCQPLKPGTTVEVLDVDFLMAGRQSASKAKLRPYG
jgi:hypothetical protein